MRRLSDVGIKQICLRGLLLRLFMLVIIMIFSDQLTTGLIGSTTDNDDVRYLEIAQTYAKSASFIIDIPAFIRSLDIVEYRYYHDGTEDLWYWIVCVLYFIVRSDFLIRMINVMFAVITIYWIYIVAKESYGEKIAKLASSLYAYFPYPIIFSCFLYKDQFYTMITLMLFGVALRCGKHVRKKDVLIMSLLVVVSMLTRSGLVVLVVSALFLILYKNESLNVNFTKKLILIPIAVAIISYLVYVSWIDINRKLLAYVYDFEIGTGQNTIDFFQIKSIQQIWKYPFALAFLLVLPLQFAIKVKSWMGLAGILNIINIPLAIGSLLYLFTINLKKDYLYWIFQAFYFLTILTSLGIVRHQYYLQPFMMIIFATYYYRNRDKTILKIISSIAILTVLYLWFRN